jgi:serine/threonine protein kinase
MEYFPCRTLNDLIASSRGVSDADCLIILRRIAGIIKQLHDREIVHRDVKSTNIFIDSHGAPHVGDYGLARATGPKMTPGAGTLICSAPEILEGGTHTPKVDCWPFGLLVYELRTGFCPFIGRGPGRFDREAIWRLILSPSVAPARLPDDDDFAELCRDADAHPTMAECIAILDGIAARVIGRLSADRCPRRRRTAGGRRTTSEGQRNGASCPRSIRSLN